MKRIVAIKMLVAFFTSLAANAITIDEAIELTNESSPEIQIQNLQHSVNKINSVELSQQALPNLYLYYNYSKPGNPRFQNAENAGGAGSGAGSGAFGRFVTGVVQENYGVAAEYNVFAIPQLFIKMNAAHSTTKSSLYSTKSKKSEFHYSAALAYIKLCRSNNLIDLQTKVFETAKSRYNEMEKYLSYGRATRKDFLSAQSAFLTAQANLAQAENDLIVAKQQYIDKFSTIHSNLTIPTTSLTEIARNLEELTQKVEDRNQELQSLRYAAKSYKAESYISAINILPTVTVGYRESYTMVDPILAIPDYRQGTFYINARMDLLNMTKYLSTFKYNKEKNKKIAEAKVAKRTYVTEAQSLWYDTINQEKMIEVLERVVKNSKEVYQITRKEVEYGSKSFTEELEMKENYTKSEINLLEANLKKAENIYKLKYLTGTL